MRRRALRILLCDRNHIIDWHTESCPSNSPRRAAAAASEENKGRFFFLKQTGSMGKKTPLPRCLGGGAVLFVSRLLSARSPRRRETMATGIAVRNSKWEDYSLFPSTADVICVPLNCCILRGSNLQSHCVKHAAGLVPCLLLAGSMHRL